MPELRVVKLFVASPGDVKHERERLDLIVARMNTVFKAAARFDCFRWERSSYKANFNFQDQIIEPAKCEIVIVIFGNRLGSELPEDFTRRLPDNTAYPSGTAYELLSALAAAEQRGKPDVYVFRKKDEPHFEDAESAEAQAARHEKNRLDAFFGRWFRTEAGGFRRAFQEFVDPDDFERQTDSLLRQWVEESLRMGSSWRIDRDGSPFRGLKAFEARQSRVYFGRDRKVGRAVEELVRAPQRERGRPFLLVVGPSGAGKSSLVRAGVIPRFTAAGVVPEVDQWRVAVMRPAGGATAFAALAEALYFNPASPDPADDPGGFGRALPELADSGYKSAPDMIERLQPASAEDAAAAAATIVAALDAVGEHQRREGGFARLFRVDLLLLVDQLEEIFDGGVKEAQRAAFARLLTALADSKRVWIVATLRADLYGRMLDSSSPFLALKDTGAQYDLASPGEAELTEILAMSAEAAGIIYEKNPATKETLDERLLRDAKGSDTLPLLQFSLEQLFESKRVVDTPDGPKAELTFEAYEALGGLDGAIDKVAEAAIGDAKNHLSSAEIEAALPRLLRRLAARVADDRAATTTQAGLTLRAAPFEEVTPDEPSRKLVDVLMQARLLVLEQREASPTDEKPEEPSRENAESRTGAAPPVVESKALPKPPLAYVRLAHERVLTSWGRARKLVAAHQAYFRVCADIERQHRRWMEGQKRREFLLAPGTQLYSAETVVRDYRDELQPELRDYVAISGRRARWRQRLTAAAATVFAIVAVVATAFALVAYSAEQQATRNYKAAKGAADDLVTSVASQLREQKGISSETVDIVFGVVDNLLKQIREAVSDQGGFATTLQAAFVWTEAHWFRTPADVGDLPAIERSRATFLYEFAETYHQSANDLKKAREKALESLKIQTRLRDAGDASPEMAVAIAMTQMELGDIERKAIEDAEPIKHDGKSVADFSPARAHYDAGQSLLAPLVSISARPDWASDESKLLTRLGDLDMKAGNREAARQHYAPAQALALQAFRAAPNELDPLHELAWSYRKLGQVEQEILVAEKTFTDEVCLRRRLVELKPNDVLYARDLGYALMWVGRTHTQSKPPDFGDAQDAFYEMFYVMLNLLERDRSKKAFFDEFGLALQRISETYGAAGNGELAGAFKSASDDVSHNASELFAELPANDPARGQAVERKKLLQQRDPMDMIEKAKETVAIQEHEFEVSRLPALRQNAESCWQRWQRLQQNAAEFSVVTDPGK
jgi:hypothetical protein